MGRAAEDQISLRRSNSYHHLTVNYLRLNSESVGLWEEKIGSDRASEGSGGGLRGMDGVSEGRKHGPAANCETEYPYRNVSSITF